MQPAAKLIRQIRDALAADGSNAPVESLAAEYAQLCQAANQRLESCAAMLGKGSEYQALQLAETEPVLLDLIATLSFAGAPEWAAYCAENQLPTPLKFDAKAVQALDGLYAKGISANHPLYKDYRAAVTSRDDGKAIQIIRSIVRLNPEDENAKAELARVENKLFQLKLQELRAALAQRDEGAILADLSELERLATPARLAELPEYASAGDVRREVARREASSVAERLVESLDEEHQAGAWRMIGDVLARLRALQSEHGFALPDKQAAKCVEMQRYFDAQRAAADEAARFQQALATLGSLAESLDSRLLTRSTLTFGEAQQLHVEFNRRWKEIEKFQRTVPEDFVQRVRTSAGALRTEMDRLQRQRRLKLVTASAAAVIVVVVAAWFAIGALRANDYATQLAGLRSAGQVEAAEKMIAEVRKEHATLAAKPKLTARLDEVDCWTRDERAKLADIEVRLAELEATAKAGMGETDPMALATRLGSTNQLIEAAAGGLRAAPAGRMLVLRNQFEAHVATLREKLIAQADGELTVLENLAGAKLGYDQAKEVVTQALAEIEPTLKSLEARVKPAVAALELPSSQQARVSAVRKRADLFHEEIDALAKVREAVLQATTLDAYLQVLGGYKGSRLAQTPEVNDARKLLAAFPKLDDLFASLLLPDDPVGWAAAKKDTTGERLAPDDVLPAEISMLVGLRDDNYLNDIWEATLSMTSGRRENRPIFSRGKIEEQKGGDGLITSSAWTGSFYTPSGTTETVAFMPRTTLQPASSSGSSVLRNIQLSAESGCLNRLELNRMTDETGSKFERPLLRAFEELLHDKAVNSVFKAFLMQQLGVVLKVRPYAWGLEYCASLRKDLAELDRLCGGEILRSQDWLLERKRAQLGPKLAVFFSGLQNRSYLTEARIHREVVRGVLKAGLQFGGFIDSAGQAHLLGEARSSKALWALGEDGQKLTRYVPMQDPQKKAKPPTAAFSPVFFVPLDRDALLTEIGRKVPNQTGTPTKLPAIPWLETP